MNRLIAFLLITICLSNITACANTPAVEPTKSPPTEIAQIEPTNTVEPTSTDEPTDTPTPEPTDTPQPTPTRTRRPTRPPKTEPPEPTSTDVIENTPTPIPTKTPFPTDPPVTEAPAATEPPLSLSQNSISISSVAELPDGERVIIAGNVVFTESFSRGFKFTVADDTGRVIVLLWDTTYDTLPGRNGLNIGVVLE